MLAQKTQIKLQTEAVNVW